MIDCINDEDSSVTGVTAEEEEEEDEDDATNEEFSEMKRYSQEAKESPRKLRKQRANRTNNIPFSDSSLPVSPSKQQAQQQQQQQQVSSLLEYVVDQKGVGSETLVVKSASTVGNNGNSGAGSASNGSRRNSIAGLSPRKANTPAIASNFSPFNPHYPSPSIPAPFTTQSHHLFPNYPRFNYNLSNALPSLDTQFDFNFINGGDLGLTALNANDFNLLDIWNNNGIGGIDNNAVANNTSSYFNTYPQSDIPRYTQPTSPQSQLNSHNAAIPSSTSQNPINNFVSDLFGDISGIF